jgi:hypothetical protein
MSDTIAALRAELEIWREKERQERERANRAEARVKELEAELNAPNRMVLDTSNAVVFHNPYVAQGAALTMQQLMVLNSMAEQAEKLEGGEG